MARSLQGEEGRLDPVWQQSRVEAANGLFCLGFLIASEQLMLRSCFLGA
jgi:hypothetical protein